jgi:chemotaxis signal transduction protein
MWLMSSTLARAELRSAPALIVDTELDFIEGLATVSDHMIVLLDVDALIGQDWVSIEPAALLGAA